MNTSTAKSNNGEDIWDRTEEEQKELLGQLRITGITEGKSNEVFVRQGYIFLLLKFHPENWETVGKEILLQGISNPRKRRERRRWWEKQGVPYYRKALDEGKLVLVTGRFKPKEYFRNNEAAGDELERLLDQSVLSDRVLLDVVDLALYMLDLQVEAERHGEILFYRGLVDMLVDLKGIYKNVQTLSRHLPFIVSGFRFHKETGADINQMPVFQCVSKAERWKKGEPRVKHASAYQLNEEYRYLLDF